MFNNIEYHKLALWINNNAAGYLQKITTNNYSKNQREKILAFLIKIKANDDNNNYRTKLSNYFAKLKNMDNFNSIFSSEKFFEITSLEEKTYYLLSHLKTLDNLEKTAFIDGLFMYAVQEQNIPVASIIYLFINKTDKLSKDFLEFLKFDQNIDGSIGIVNPLRDKNITSQVVEDWVLFNSLYVYVILPLRDRSFESPEK